MREKRIEKILDIIEEKNLDACVLKGMDNIFYLTGFRGSEGLLLITRGDVVLVVDGRYTTHAREVAHGVYVAEMKPRQNVLGDLCDRYGLKTVGFDSLHTSYYAFDRWRETIAGVDFVPMGLTLEEIRRCKEPEEIDAIMTAIRIATESFLEVYDTIRPGRTEKEIANDLDYAMRARGAEGASFDTIVASGERAALPHGEPSSKQIRAGDTVIIDFGARIDGYCSDETCTVLVGEVGEEMEKAFSIVHDAKELAIGKIRAGVPVRDLDMVVRGYIENAGFGDYFSHGTGHGVGIAVHEAPSVNSVAEGILEENMVITIEPGIYIPNRGGVRLEDMVLVTEEKGVVLTELSKGLFRKKA